MGRYDPATCAARNGRVLYCGFTCGWYHERQPKERHTAQPMGDRSPGFFGAPKLPTAGDSKPKDSQIGEKFDQA